jgi:hypothetical protein
MVNYLNLNLNYLRNYLYSYNANKFAASLSSKIHFLVFIFFIFHFKVNPSFFNPSWISGAPMNRFQSNPVR